MQTDLLLNKEEQLWQFCQDKKLFSSVDVYGFGGRIYYTRACRTVRQWAEEGRIKRLDHGEMVFRGLRITGRAAVAWYEAI